MMAHLVDDPCGEESDANQVYDDAQLPLASFWLKVTTAVVVIVPFLGVFAAAWLAWGGAFTWYSMATLIVMYLLTGLGITVGFHRLFTHRSFETYGVVRALLGILGCMAIQGPILKWVAEHRKHHRNSDHHDDPHSPHHHGPGWVAMFRGLLHSHLGWLFRAQIPDWSSYVSDLLEHRGVRILSRLFPVWVLLGLAIPAVAGWLLGGGWAGAMLGLIWGGFVRVFLIHHVTWSINSICHIWGRRAFNTRDQSRNNIVFGILALGEGWHNNHHAFPSSARHGLYWWQLDLSYLVIRAMESVGLAWNVKRPTQRQILNRSLPAGMPK